VNKLVLALACAFALDASAVSTRAFTSATYKELDEGEADSAVISSDGAVLPGVTTRRQELEAESVWTAVRAPDGTVYTGSIDGGLIYAVSSGGRRKVATLDMETPWIGALALGPDGTLYVGTLGVPQILAIDPNRSQCSATDRRYSRTAGWSVLSLGSAGRPAHAR
jgi:glucose/arabinose dehydrogenase